MTKKISEVASVQQLSDAEYLLGVDATGKIIKIEKQKAYPVATATTNGLMSKDGFIFRDTVLNTNEAKLSGIYICRSETINTPVSDYYVLDVVRAGQYIIQRAFRLNSNAAFFRRSIDAGANWSVWTQF